MNVTVVVRCQTGRREKSYGRPHQLIGLKMPDQKDEPSKNDTYAPTVAVAALDLLGVKTLVSKDDSCLAAMNVLSKFVKNAASRWAYADEKSGKKHEKMYELDLYFGDSLYLFADSSRDIETQVQWLAIRVSTLVALGLWWTPRFLVRAGIAAGDLRKRVAKGDGGAHEIRIGTSMTRAHELQDAQEWIGGAIDPAAPFASETAKWTVEYPVPLKSSSTFVGSAVPLNWIWSNGSQEQIEREV